ncbi:MAG TPA: hypothetical protein VFT22_25545, partial [Kofleriaceae bacterium]|nr:hypothetical protein [Kofleriaceae bacterium]
DPAPAPRAPGPSTDASPNAHAQPASAAPTSDLPSDLPTLDPAALIHFANIERALTQREAMLARALAAELSPAELRAWLNELKPLSVPDAVAKIQGVLGPDAGSPPPASSPPSPSGSASTKGPRGVGTGGAS